MPTRLTIEEAVVRYLNQRDQALATIPVPLTVSADSVSATTIKATILSRGTRDANAYDGRLVKVTTVHVPGNSTTGASVGQISGVVEAGFDGTEILTINPALDDVVRADQELIVYALSLDPDFVVKKINEALRKTEAPHIWFPSLVKNSDFEDDDGASPPVPNNWNDVGTPTSVLIDTDEADVLLGRSIAVIAAAGDDGTESDSFNVNAGETLLVSCWVRQGTTILTVTLRDQTGAADIVAKTVDGEGDWVNVRFTQEIADGVEACRLRFGAAGADTFHVAAHVVVQSTAGRAYQSPRGLVRQSQLVRAFEIPSGLSLGTDYYLGLSGDSIRDVAVPTMLRSDRDAHVFHVQFAVRTQPLGLMYQRAFAEMTSTDGGADSTPADEDWLVARAIANILRDKGDAGYQAWSQKAADRARILGYGSRELVIEPVRRTALGR